MLIKKKFNFLKFNNYILNNKTFLLLHSNFFSLEIKDFIKKNSLKYFFFNLQNFKSINKLNFLSGSYYFIFFSNLELLKKILFNNNNNNFIYFINGNFLFNNVIENKLLNNLLLV